MNKKILGISNIFISKGNIEIYNISLDMWKFLMFFAYIFNINRI